MPKPNEALQEMLELFGEEGVAEILEAYGQTLDEFENFLKAGEENPAVISKAAHKMKSPSLSVGQTDLAEYCIAFELTGKITPEERTRCLNEITSTRMKLGLSAPLT